MAIRIVRNEAGNCINFHGASNPTYWNACLSGQVDTTDTNAINIINDIITAQTGVTEYEFFRVPYTDFVDAEGNSFASAQEAADYVTEKANVVGLSGDGIDLTGQSVCFHLDATSTSILLSNGYSFGVNTIKAVEVGGDISIISIDTSDSITHFYGLEVGNACIGSDVVPGGLNDVINALNELFTVGAFESVVISDPFSTMVANVNGENAGYTLEGTTAIDPAGDDIFTNSSSGNYAGLKSVATINQAGEYFTFDIRGEGQIGFGLVHTQESYDASYFSGNSNYADPGTFAVSNSAHYGFQFSHWFHPTPNGSWTNYGANTSYSMKSGWSNWESQDEWLAGNPVKIKVGIDENGFISISSLQDDNTTWVVHARTSYPITDGSEFHLGIKTANASARVYTAPKVHLLDSVQAPTTLGTDAITVFGEGITGTLAGGITSSATDNFDNDGFVTAQVINASGEYFEFTWSSGGDANFGLFSENDHDVSELTSDTAAWGNDDYVFYGARAEDNGSMTGNYEENSMSDTLIGTANDTSVSQYYGRIGFDGQGRATIWYSTDGITYNVYRHAQNAAPSGEYKFIWIAQDDGAILNSLQQGVIDTAPTMYFRYIESPDGYYSYPLFATQEEADYYELITSGSDNGSHTHVYPDDPTFATWYMPSTSNQMNYGLTPIEDGVTSFEGNTINWTEITSLTNADLIPPAYTSSTITVNELSSVNIQLQPADTAYTTSVTDNDGAGLFLIGSNLEGTSPEVLNDNVSNPSDTYTFTITRTNTYGSSTGTLTLVVNNLTAPVTAISGFNHISGTTAMIDSDTMDDGSAVHVNTTVADGKRFVIEQAYIETNILPNLTATNDMYIIGLANQPETFGDGVALSDFDAAIVWEYESATSHTYKFYRDGSVVQNVVINSATDAFYDYAIEINGTSAWLIACNVNSIMNEPSPADGGNFSNTYEATNIEDSAPVTIHMAALNTTGDISTTDIETIDTPAAPVGILTSWSKALDFSGGSERAQQVSSDYTTSPLKMGGTSNLVAAPSAGQTVASGHPFATTVVFQTPNNTTNQHIWNSGEGAGSGDDNMYLRIAGTNGELYFGWGREGVGYNEYHIGNFGGSYNQSTGQWWGIYIAHDGTRLSGADATAANLVNAFDIRLMGTNDVSPVFSNLYDVGNDVNNWVSTGFRMDRAILGDFTVGGRGANRSFHGKVASMVVTTLKCGVAMPDSTEIAMMLTDPIKWMQDYKEGQTFRQSLHTTATTNWDSSVGTTKAFATQIWLMGDGTNDSYSNMIRNQVFPSDQNYTKLNLISMVSNDIENVTINGLS